MALKSSKRGMPAGTKLSTRRKIATALALSAPVLSQFAVLAPQANAGSAAWTGTTDSSWANSGNWTPVTVPGTGDTATFNSAGATHTTISVGSIGLTGLTFTTGASAYTIGAAPHTDTITLDDGGAALITLLAGNPAVQTINADLILGTVAASTTTITNASTSSLTIAGNITGGTTGTTAGAKTIAITGTGAILLNGNIAPGTGVTGGSIVVTDTSTGALTLGGANTIATFNQNAASTINVTNAAAFSSATNYNLGITTGSAALNLGTNSVSLASLSLSNPTAATTLTLTGTLNVPLVTFNGAGAFGVTLTGGTINLGTGGIIDASAAANNVTGEARTISSTLLGNNVTIKSGNLASGGGLVTISGTNTSLTGVVNLQGMVTFASQNAASNQQLVISAANAGILANANLSLTNAIALNNTAQLRAYSTATLTLSGPISGAGGINTVDAGVAVLSGNNTFTGKVALGGTTLSVASINSVNGGTPLLASSGLGAPTTIANGTIDFGSTTVAGGLTYTGSGETTDRVVNLAGTTGGGTITQNGTGILKFTSNGTATGVGAKTLTLQGTGAGEFAGIIVENSVANPTSVTKNGTGSWILSASNTYTGATTVTQGTLLVNGQTGAGSVVSIGSNGTLGGSGTINGAVVVSPGTNTGGTINPGTVGTGTVGSTLTLSSATGLAINNLGRLNFDITSSSASGNDRLSLTGLPTIAGIAQINLNLIGGGSLTSGQVYTLLNGYTGTIANGTNIVPGTITGDTGHSFIVQNNAGSVSVLITNGATPTTAYWSGAADASWNTVTPGTNWRTSATSGVDTGGIPGSVTDVHFVTTTPTAGNLSTTIDASLAINTLAFDSSVTSAVSIAGPGTLGILGAAGITNNSATGGAVTISTPVSALAAQTWTNNNATNTMTFSAPVAIAGTLSVTGAGAMTINAPVSGASGITKTGTGTLTFGGANTYTGGTVLNGGTIKYTADNTAIAGLTFGVLTTTGTGTNNTGSTTVSAIDASTTPSNVTTNALTVLTNSASANTISIGAGKTFSSTGGLTLGFDGSLAATLVAATSKLAFTGAGNVSITGATVNIGISQSTVNAANTSTGIVDLTGLTGNFTANVTGNFNVGLGNTNSGQLLLGNGTNTIQATTLIVGHSNGNNGGATSTLTLGTGTNIGTYVINADTIQVGFSKIGGTLAVPSSTAGTGSITITNKAGTGGAAITIGSNNGTGTGATFTGTMDLRGHQANVTAGAVSLGITNTASTGWAAGILSFDTGTFSATSLSIGSESGATTGSPTTTALNVGGGSFTVSGATTVATSTATAAGAITAAMNISGGTFTTGSLAAASSSGATAVISSATSNITISGSGILNTGNFTGAAKTAANTGVDTLNLTVSGGQFNVNGTSFILASQATAGSAVATMNLTGGTVTSNADITVSGTTTTTLTLNGGTLNMNGRNIGAAGALISTINLQAGTLQNIGSINANAALTKTTTGTLTLAGGNSNFGSALTVNGGTLAVNQVSSGAGLITINGSTTTPSTLIGTGVIGGAVTLATNGATSAAQGPVLNPGGVGTVGQLSINGVLTTQNFSNLNFDLTSNPTGSDSIFTSSLPVLGATTTVNINSLSTLSNGTYVLIGGYTGTIATTPTLVGAAGASLVNIAGALELVVGSTGAGPTVAYWAGAIDGNWGTNSGVTNWRTSATSGADSGLPGTSTNVHFVTTTPAPVTVTTALDQSFNIASLTFDATSTSAVTINGPGTLTLSPGTGGTGLTLASGAAAVTIAAPISLATSQTWANNSSNLLTFGSLAGPSVLTLGGTGTGGYAQTTGMNISGLVVPSGFGGVVTLNQANTITGSVTISGGSVVATANAGALGTGTVTMGGGSLTLTNASGANLSFGRNTVVSASSTITSNVLATGAGDTFTMGTLSIGAQTLTIAGGGNVNSGTSGLTFGLVTLTGSPTFTVNNPAAGGNTLLTLGNVGGGAFSITKNGTGTLTLAGGGTYTGGVNLSAGTLNVGTATSLGTGALTIASGTTLDNISGAALTMTSNNAVTINGSYTFAGGTGTTHDLNQGTGAVTLGATSTITVNNASTLTYGGAFGFGANALTKAGPGTLTLSGIIAGTTANGSNVLTVNGGTLNVTGVNSSFSGNIIVDGTSSVLQVAGSNGSATGGMLGYVTGGTTTPAFKTITLQNGGIFRSLASFNDNAPTAALPANGYVFIMGTGGGVLDVPTGITLTLDDGAAAGTGTGNSELQGSGALTKTGAGILALGSGTTNTFAVYTGGITASAGIIQLGNATAPLGATTAGTTILSGAALNVNGTVQTSAEPLNITGVGTGATAGALYNGSATAATYNGPITLSGDATIGMSAGGLVTSGTIAVGANTLTFNNAGTGNLNPTGVISGVNGKVVVTGAGQYVPSAQNTYTGGTTLSAGTSTIPQASSTGNPGAVTSGPFGTGPITVSAGSAAIRASVGSNITIANSVTLNGGITFLTAATENNFTFSGPVTLAGGDAIINSTVGNTVAGRTAIISGNIGDGGSGFGLTKTGTGNLMLSGANTFGGATIVSAGTLNLTGTLAANTGITLNAGANLSLISGAANPLSSISTLNLGAGTGFAQVGLDLGTSSDTLATANAATTTNSIAFNLAAISGFGAGTYNLISAAGGGLNAANYSILTAPVGFTYTLNKTDSLVSLNVVAGSPTLSTLYWRGAINNSWIGNNAGVTNFTTDAAGTVNSGVIPTYNNTVVFSAAGATGPAISTTLDQPLAVNDLQFVAAPTGVTSVTIANGTGNNLLTIQPQSPTVGVSIAQGAGAITLSVPINLGAPQTWTVDSSTPTAGTASSLTVSNSINGPAGNSLTLSNTAGTTPITFAASGSNYSGTTTISANTIVQGGATNGFSPNSALIVNGTLQTSTAATGFSQAVGSLIGGNGIIQNGHASTATTLTIGNDNFGTSASPATFGGTIQNGGVGTLGITKAGTGFQILTGTNTYTGATTVNGGTLRLSGTNGATAVTVNSTGTLQIGIPTALTSANNVTLAGTGVLDLFGNSVTIGTSASATTSTITNTGTGTGASSATTLGTPAGSGVFVDALTINTAATSSSVPALITDGPTRKTQIILNNGNLGTTFSITNAANTFSGGVVLANNASGTRLDISAPAVVTALGTGPIIVGQAATDKAGIFFPAAVTVTNPVVMNTNLGTDRYGIRSDIAGVTFSGVLTANVDAVLSGNATTSAIAFTNQITGVGGLVLDASQTSTASTVLNVTLNNATANPNNYAGDTVVGRTSSAPTVGLGTVLTLGRADQIPNGVGFGNVQVLNFSATATGTLNLNGFSETINGLAGSGTVDGVSGNPTLTLGDNNATTTFSGVLKNTAGTLNIVKIGTGTQTFSGANTFTGSLTVNSGLLAFPSSPATAGPLGNTTTVNLNGGGISYTGTTTNVLNRTVSIGAGNGTLDVLSSLGTLSITSVTSTGGNLIKTGPGAAVIAGSTTLNTGAAGVVVNNGVLQAGFGTGGISSINVSALGNLSFQNSAAEVLTLGGTGSLTLASGSKLGFELGAVGTNDEVIYKTATASGTVSLNIINLGGGLGAGSYTLLTSSTAGQLAGVNFTLGSAPAGFNYAIDNDGTTVTLTTLNYQPIYWRGGVDLSWSTLGAGPANWTTDAAGTLDSDHTPAPNETVIFSAALAPTLSNTITTTLNGAFTIDSIQFTNVPTGVTGVTINAGTGGALTLKPASASGGLLLATGAGNVTINAPITLDNTLSPSQTWSVTDATSILNIAGNVAFGANMVKSGAGILTLSGNNTGTGSITLSAGTLNVNSLTALGTGTFNIGGGTTLDNTSGATVAMTANNPVNITGDFTFTGSNSLNLGTGATTLGNSPTITISANTLTVGGAVGGTGGFTKSGAGILVLAGNNTYAGLTTVSQGTLNLLGNNTNAGGVTLSGGALGIGNAGALGTGTFTINSGTIDNLTGAALTTGSNALAVNGSFTFTGSKDLNLGTGPITTSVTPTITVAASTLTLGNNINGANGLTKAGPGALTLSGASTYNGPTTVSAGTLNLTGSFSTPLLGNISVANSATFNVLGPITASNPFTTTVNGGTVNVNSPITDAALGTIAVNSGTLNVAASVTGSAATTTLTYGNTASTTGIVNVTGGTSTLFATQGASVAGAVSVWNQTGGNVTVSPGTGNSQYVVKSVAGAYGYFNLTGGNYKNTGRFDVSATSNVGLGTVGAVFVGGTNALLDNSNGEWFINGYGLNSTTVGVGGTIDRTGASNRVGIMMDSTVSGGTYGVINLAGGNFIQTTLNSFTFGNSATTTSQFGDVGYLNLAGGNLSLGGGVIVNVPTSAPAAINTGYINFSGANIKGTATATLVPASTVGINVISTIFGQTINNGSLGATFNGGATTGLNLDTNGFTITAASPIASASGLGVTQTDMTVAGGSGYVGAPVVQFSTAGLVAGGTPAQGYAVLDGAGHVAGIVITDPGTYAAGTTPTVTLAGGGGTGASITLATLTAANVAGGLNLTDTAGTGNFVVTAANTYTGTTNIGVGAKLSLGAAGTTGALSPSSAIVNNGNLTINRTNAVAQGTEFSTAPITGTGAMTVTGASNTTVVTLNAANTFSGGVTLISTQGTAAGPVLILANSAAAGTGTLTLRSSGFGGADTLQISGSGLNIANPIVMDTTLGFREGIDNVATSGANTLSGGITISGTTAQALIIANNSATGVLTVSGNITATGGNASSVSLRGVGSTGMGLLTGTVTLNGVLDSNVGGIWTIKPATSGANTWTQTQLNSTVAGSGLKLGIDNALPPVDLLWGTTAVGTLDLAGFNQTVAGAAASLATPIITNSGATDSTLTFAALTATKNFTGVIQNGATNKINLVMNSAGQTQILSGANTYSGPTTITAGTLQLGNLGATGTLNPLSTITDNSAFVISRTGTVTQGTDFSTAAITGTGTFTNASSGTTVFTANNTYAGVTTISAGTLQIGAGGTVGSMGPNSITDTGTLSFNRTDTFTMLATQLVTGTGGVTLMNSGPVVASVDNQFNVSGPLTFGASAGATTASTLDLTGASSTFGPLTVLTNNPTANTIIVGPGKTLTNNGNVTIGYATPQATASVVKLTMTGGGNYVATGSGATFQVGGSTSTTLSEASTLDMTGLASATINLGATGTFRVAQPSGTNLAGNQSTLLLPAPSTGVTPTTPVTTITTNLFNVGDNSGNVGNAGQTNAVTLGTGLTTLNVNTINVGTGGRDLGQITVAAGNGTIKLRAADGASRVAVNIGTGTANTAVGQGTGVTNKIDFTGHSADLQISTLAIGAQNRNTNRDDLFAFDTGNLDVTGVVLATNTGAANGTVATGIVNTSTLSIGGGTTTIGAGGVDIGFGQTAVTATSTHTLIGNLNVSGGSVTIANNPTLGAAIRMSNNTIAAGLTANSNLNVTGSGSVALAGDIIKGSSAGAGTASIAVNGPTALLDMGGHNIGTATAIINSFAYTDGVVKDLGIAYGPVTLAGTGSRVFNQTGVQSGEIRGVVSGTGVGLSKTGTGSLTLSGTNTYTGSTTVSAGMLLVNGSIGTSASTVQSGGTLSGTGTTGTVSVLSGGTVTGGSTFASIAGKLSTADLGMASGSTLAMDIDGTTAGNGAGKYDQLSITGAIDLNTDAGTGANLVVNFPNNFAPTIGDVYYVALNDGTDPVNNFFNGLPEGQVVLGSNGSQFTISYLANGDGGTVANDIALTTTIPEPATASLLAVAGIGLLSRRRRRAGSR